MAAPTIFKLPTLVHEAFSAAQKNGGLTFYPTKVSILHCDGIPFQVRFSAALANKPKSNKLHNPEEKPFDPFSDPPKDLFIADLPFHNLILNKFPIIPDHFILATKEFKEQTTLLEEDDLGAAYECIHAYRENEEELFGFFNSGEHSGASQRHRHLQFLPVESMRSGLELGQSWEVMADTLTKTPKPDLPFVYLSSTLPKSPSPQTLHETYINLHTNACRIAQGSKVTTSATDSTSPISYNLGLTNKAMVLCPRTSEGVEIKNHSGEDIGFVALNGTILGGTLLVKSEEEYLVIRNDPLRLIDILSAIGFSSNHFENNQKL